MSRIQIRQSDLKTWAKCPLIYRWEHIENLSRLQSGSLTFGSIMHDVVLWMETNPLPDGQPDIEGAIARFHHLWADPARLGDEYPIDYYVAGTNWRKFSEKGPQILRNWGAIIRWDSALVLAREHAFSVPIGDGHVLDGTVDKLEIRYHAKINEWVVLISDYKTNNKVPTYNYLQEDLQFSAYGYASLQPEFWTGIENGEALFEKYRNYRRFGEWVSLVQPKRMDAGERVERHYNRLIMAVNAMAMSVGFRIFVPNITGETCRYCDYRKQCGLPELMDDGELSDEELVT